MKLKISFTSILCLVIGFVPLFAATYRPVSLHGQISESSGVIIGKYVGKNYKRLADGLVVTEASFSVEMVSGLNNDQIKNPQDFKIHYPGGTWQGIVYMYDGMPLFEPDKKYLLLITNDGFGYGITGQSLGVYEVEKSGYNESTVRSTVFPDHIELGNHSLTSVNNLVAELLDGPLRAPNQEKVVFINKNKNNVDQNRSPASLDEASESNEPTTNTVWIVMLFSMIGLVTVIVSKKRG